MGILALPLFGFLLYFWVPGIQLARGAMHASKSKAVWMAIFACILAVEFLIGFCGPLALSRGETVDLWSLMFAMTFRYVAAALLGWICVRIFRSSQKEIFRTIASSLFISAALFPVAWFTVTRSLMAAFGVRSTA